MMGKEQYGILYVDEATKAGFATIKNDEVISSILCRGGSHWKEAIFNTKKDALSAIRRTNNYRKRKGWESSEYLIVNIPFKRTK